MKNLSDTSVLPAAGQLVGFSKVTGDLTEHKRLERCVKEREETHRVMRPANAGTWAWHLEADRVEVCANFLQLLGHGGVGSSLSLAAWLAVLIADTGHGQEQDRRAALKAGFRHHLMKPVGPALLVELLPKIQAWRQGCASRMAPEESGQPGATDLRQAQGGQCTGSAGKSLRTLFPNRLPSPRTWCRHAP